VQGLLETVDSGGVRDVDSDAVVIERLDGGVIVIRINRPERLNALGARHLKQLRDAVDAVGQGPDSRAILLTGTGKAFCVGGDFKDADGAASAAGSPPHEFLVFYRDVVRVLVLGLRNARVPTIAMVNGPAHGLGFDLALACDIRVGSELSSFCCAWLRRAIVPAGGTTWLLPPLIGMSRAAEIILSAREVGGEEADRIGILSRFFPHEQLEAETMALASAIAEGAPIALWLTKTALYEGQGLDGPAALDMLAGFQVVAFGSEDFTEAIQAFRDKRPPKFSGR
jgi:enoyl-CoA hydratase/carnithine racemase